ncbi:aminotransferase class V-fold PLP-dependent enzyme [Devosia sp. 63-57]|uniref:pyridoxal-phosphate-dependent aminotransferase family protein n=1 Tax=Devosia sp. 63-57 TaxID=1895751 RepID=UPI00086D79F7|nr:aminotransferase class V-fold PLP-dependent enzyme [Devosia sp. 63-57]ODT49881.1 MAG: septum site-determining protein [Pelagibacterium sp. SCN 63-126]ODU85915.1 MAG: septum site-determining protein [Pelagibacterium sp. SCN 63-17]OJX45256.1 MAG: septum site-determining protein [Devosia sp. 63-57]
MPIATGHTYLAIPGPSVIPERVLNAMHRASPNIYEGELIAQTEVVFNQLKRLAGTQHHVAIYIANGHGGWEAALSNMFSRGDKALALASGLFGTNWAKTAQRMQIDVDMLDFGRAAADPEQVTAALAADRERRIKAVLVTHVDTASGIKNDIPALRRAMDETGHPALLAVDAIASLGCDELRMDEWGVDVLVGASQKGLMLPPGLALIWMSDKAAAVARAADLKTPYWDITPRIEASQYWQHFGGTPPTHHIFGLHEALSMMLDEEGLDAVWARHGRLARAIWAAFDAWGAGDSGIRLMVENPAWRGHSVTAATIPNGGAGALRRWMEQETGVTLGIGLGMALPSEPEYDDFLRIGHMGHVNAHMVLGVLACMDAGMQVLGIARGRDAIEAAAAALG